MSGAPHGREVWTADIRLTTARAFAKGKDLATYGRTIESFPYGTDTPDVTRSKSNVPGDRVAVCVICSRVSMLFVIDVDDRALFKTTATYKAVGEAMTVRRAEGRYHVYVNAIILASGGAWLKGGKIPGADIKGAGLGGLVMAAGTVHESGQVYEVVGGIIRWSGSIRDALAADGVEIVPAAWLGRAGGDVPDVEDVTGGWGSEPADGADYAEIAGERWGTEGGTDGAAVAVCKRLLNYAEEYPESAADIFADLVTGYESRPGYAGRGETAMRRALAAAAAGYVSRDEYWAERDREDREWVLAFIPPAELAEAEERIAREREQRQRRATGLEVTRERRAELRARMINGNGGTAA